MEVGHQFAALDSAKYLYLREISEPRDNSLQLLIDEAAETRSGPFQDCTVPNLKMNLTNISPIATSDSCRSFELTWASYVAYLVTEECVGSCGNGDDEMFRGKLFRIYSKSHFLDHLARDTGAHTHPIQHYKLTCMNHLIDVASYAPPVIRVVATATSASTRKLRT
jgi:hypothetical protein